MEHKSYTNVELARDYFSVVAPYSGDLMTYNFQKRKITELGIDLPTFYLEHGRSLNELQVGGIGKKTKGILELILDRGVEEARRLVSKGKIDEMRRSLWSGIPSKVPRRVDDTSPSWDDAVKRYEGN